MWHNNSKKNMEWKHDTALVEYEPALTLMEERVADILAGKAPELIWLLEHPPLYTAGTSAISSDLLDPTRFPVYETGRGGQYTYHGPGMRIAYTMLDLKKRAAPEAPDLRHYVRQLEQWVINTLAVFEIKGERRQGRIGIWVTLPDGKEAKIAAIGIRVRRWVTFHGIALNVRPDLSHYQGIVPCGITEHGVTSLEALGVDVSMQTVDDVLKKEFFNLFMAS